MATSAIGPRAMKSIEHDRRGDGLGVAGTMPIDMVNENSWSVFTTP